MTAAGGASRDAQVGVPVATMWTDPAAVRDLDEPALWDVPDIAAWTAALDAEARADLHGRTLTQLLLGEPVRVVEERGHWAFVTAPHQPSSRAAAGYPGWVRRAHLASAAPAAARTATVVAPSSRCEIEDGAPVPVSFGTVLGVVEVAGRDVRVDLPGGRRGRVRSTDVLLRDAEGPDVAEPAGAVDGQDLLATAREFLGLRYLWGGTSGWGMDCSGLVHLVLRVHGVRVPRDAFDQAHAAAPVALHDVRPGDLYFFARPHERVYHVGFVSRAVAADGVRRMLHAPEGGELVEDAPLAQHRVETLVAAGRMVGAVP